MESYISLQCLSSLFVQEGLNMSDPFCTHSISHELAHKAGSSNTHIGCASENQNVGKIVTTGALVHTQRLVL